MTQFVSQMEMRLGKNNWDKKGRPFVGKGYRNNYFGKE